MLGISKSVTPPTRKTLECYHFVSSLPSSNLRVYIRGYLDLRSHTFFSSRAVLMSPTTCSNSMRLMTFCFPLRFNRDTFISAIRLAFTSISACIVINKNPNKRKILVEIFRNTYITTLILTYLSYKQIDKIRI